MSKGIPNVNPNVGPKVIAKVSPYGSWKSPICSKDVASETLRLSQPQFDGPDLYWLEGRPSEGGIQTLVCKTPDGHIFDVSPSGFNVRSSVNEYGGAPFLAKDKKIFLSNYANRVVYQLDNPSNNSSNNSSTAKGDNRLIALTPEGSEARFCFADFAYDSKRHRLLVVAEDHSNQSNISAQPKTTINCVATYEPSVMPLTEPVSDPANKTVSAGLTDSEALAEEIDHRPQMVVLLEGNDFYSNPRISPDGSLLAWISWDHPNMPWDGTTLWLAEFDTDGSLINKRKIAGADDESVMQPLWAPNGDLLFISDRSGWWNLYAVPNP